MSRSFELPEAEWATVGTVGEPGQRTFYMQAAQGYETLTLKLEKQQVAALAEFLEDILSDLPTPTAAEPDPALREPIEAEWAVGSLQLAYDGGSDRVVILAEEAVLDEELTEASEAATARIGLSREVAAMIARIGAELVAGGRPPCPLCGRPMDPSGHACVRANGHRPTS